MSTFRSLTAPRYISANYGHDTPGYSVSHLLYRRHHRHGGNRGAASRELEKSPGAPSAVWYSCQPGQVQSQVECLGHRIDCDGIHATDSKLEAITQAPPPNNVQQLCSFLGLLKLFLQVYSYFGFSDPPS